MPRAHKITGPASKWYQSRNKSSYRGDSAKKHAAAVIRRAVAQLLHSRKAKKVVSRRRRSMRFGPQFNKRI